MLRYTIEVLITSYELLQLYLSKYISVSKRRDQLEKLPQQVRETIVRFDELCRNETELEKLVSAPRVIAIEILREKITAETLALRQRSRLNLDEKPIRDIRKLLIKLGTRVFFLPIADRKISGLSWWHKEYGPCILVNGYDEPRGRRAFTMAHELAHLIRGGLPTICDLEYDEPEEVFANSFASQFLIPADDLRREFNHIVGLAPAIPDNKQLGMLASRYGVSLEATSRRLESLDLVPHGITEKYLAEWNAIPRRFRGAKGPRWKHQLGNYYVDLALNAYSRGNISVGKLAQYLGVDVRTASEVSRKSP